MTDKAGVPLFSGHAALTRVPRKGPLRQPSKPTTKVGRRSQLASPVASASSQRHRVFKTATVELHNADVLSVYATWSAPVAIISDGPYGLGSFPGDPPTPDSLPEWYRPHIEAWSQYSTGETTLWFWNSEIGWATVHPVIKEYGWRYRCCHVWDKGLGHIAGNANSKTLRKLPVTTEVCVQYTHEPVFRSGGVLMSMKDWLRCEWERTGLPFHKTNEACGVKNAATRKYFTKDHLWYFPPVECFVRLTEYANRHGMPKGRPYFSIDGVTSVSGEEWSRMRAKFHCPVGLTNVWREPPVRGQERLKRDHKCIHTNQKPVSLMQVILQVSTDRGDAVWEPFGGLCSATVACLQMKRKGFAAEILPEYFAVACARLQETRRILE